MRELSFFGHSDDCREIEGIIDDEKIQCGMTRIGDVLGRKHTIDILLYLLDRDTSPTKFDVFKALGCRKVVASRIDEMESDGLVEVCRNGGKHNPHHIRLTWYGKKIAVALRECNYLFEKITS